MPKGGKREWTPCRGTMTIPAEYRLDNGHDVGKCVLCGKWCRLQGGRVTMPKHKKMGENAWESRTR